ncbi:trichohyalin-like isoform X3 [Daktulosphaira vitifoliae]|nr:trichohyalin-like isoform X3 [Daktulosphaira vitifoliae]XP_050547704.1 trichohyalin-like isoform X3 [Daktulosphaira vitifoliae]
MKKQSSRMFFNRHFSKYTSKLRGKLSRNFKSSFKSTGKYDESSTKYKSYVEKGKNKKDKNKTSLKYSLCSIGFKDEVKKKKRTVKCKDLPGPGTYNHRFVYDEASRLRKEGKDVDVLYKVKTKNESTYVINGEFKWKKKLTPNEIRQLRKKYSGASCTTKRSKAKKSQKKNTKANDVMTKRVGQHQLVNEEDALLMEELHKQQKLDEEKKRRMDKINKIERMRQEKIEREKLEKLKRRERSREAAKRLRINTLNKLKETNLLREEERKKEALILEELAKKKENKKMMEKAKLEEENIKLEEIQRLQQLKLQKLNTIKQKVNVENDKQGLCNENSNAAEKCTKNLNDCENPSRCVQDHALIERWVLRNDDGISAMSWLRLVTHRTNCLKGHVHKQLRDEWLRIAIDTVVDCMVKKKCLPCNKKHDFTENICEKRDFTEKKCNKQDDEKICKKKICQVSSICNHSKPFNVHAPITVNIGKSAKCIDIPGSAYYTAVKKEGNYYQVMNVNFMAKISKHETGTHSVTCVGQVKSNNKHNLDISILYKCLLNSINHVFG